MAKVRKTAKKVFAVCELVQPIVLDGQYPVVENTARVKVIDEYFQEHAAGIAAAKYAVELEERPPEGYKTTVAVISIWRVR